MLQQIGFFALKRELAINWYSDIILNDFVEYFPRIQRPSLKKG